MSWDIVVGIGTLVGFVVGAMKIITPLTNAITTLTQECNNLNKNMERLEKENSEKEREMKSELSKVREEGHEGRKRIWHKIDEQQDELQSHETRIKILEKNI